MKIYNKLGLPGAVGSMDCTHISWEKCPNNISNICYGKEKKTTLAFEVIVDHSKYIVSVSQAFFGSTNDKTIVRNDSTPQLILSKELYKDRIYPLYNKDGSIYLAKGVFLITDGGYLDTVGFIDPIGGFAFDFTESLWTTWIESIRKDIECLFGMLKMRFQFLKKPNQYHNFKTIEAAFHTACILHNIILLYDGNDIKNWEDANWESLNPDDDCKEDEILHQEFENEDSEAQLAIPKQSIDEFIRAMSVGYLTTTEEEIEEYGNLQIKEFTTKAEHKMALINHFNYCWSHNKVLYPRPYIH